MYVVWSWFNVSFMKESLFGTSDRAPFSKTIYTWEPLKYLNVEIILIIEDSLMCFRGQHDTI